MWESLPFYALGAAVIVALIFYMRGRSAAKVEQAEARTDAIRDKKEKDDEVENLGPADLDSRFNRWDRE